MDGRHHGAQNRLSVRLRAKAARYRIDLSIRGLRGEALDLPEGARPWLFDGCRLHRDTHATLTRAGLASRDMNGFMLSSPVAMVRPHMVESAVR